MKFRYFRKMSYVNFVKNLQPEQQEQCVKCHVNYHISPNAEEQRRIAKNYRDRWRRTIETPEAKEIRKSKNREKYRNFKNQETFEQAQIRRQKTNERSRLRRFHQTVEQRKIRWEKNRIYSREHRAKKALEKFKRKNLDTSKVEERPHPTDFLFEADHMSSVDEVNDLAAIFDNKLLARSDQTSKVDEWPYTTDFLFEPNLMWSNIIEFDEYLK